MPCWKTLLDQTYTIHFSIYGLQYRARLYLGTFSQYRRISFSVSDLSEVSSRRFQEKMVVIPHQVLNMDDGSITMMRGLKAIFETA